MLPKGTDLAGLRVNHSATLTTKNYALVIP